MKTIVIPVAASTLLLLFPSLAPAETVNIPEDEPAISLDIPDSWKPEVNDNGIGCESPDKVATIYFEVTAAKRVESLIEDNVEWLTKEQSVQINKTSEQKEDFENSGRKWSRISWDGDSQNWGPGKVGFLFTDAGEGKILTVTYWILNKGHEKDLPDLTKMLDSVKQIGS